MCERPVMINLSNSGLFITASCFFLTQAGLLIGSEDYAKAPKSKLLTHVELLVHHKVYPFRHKSGYYGDLHRVTEKNPFAILRSGIVKKIGEQYMLCDTTNEYYQYQEPDVVKIAPTTLHITPPDLHFYLDETTPSVFCALFENNRAVHWSIYPAGRGILSICPDERIKKNTYYALTCAPTELNLMSEEKKD